MGASWQRPSPWAAQGTLSGLGLSFDKAKGQKDLRRLDPRGLGKLIKETSCQGVSKKGMNYRRGLFQSKALRFPVILCKTNSSRAY